MPETASVMPRRSGHLLRKTAEMTPITRPKTTDQTIDVSVSQRVGPKRSPISWITGRCERIEMPKSPWTAPATKCMNCSGIERSRPRL